MSDAPERVWIDHDEIYIWHDPKPESIATEYVRADIFVGVLEALERIVNAGEWYASALEINPYVSTSVDGVALEKMARDAIAKATGGTNKIVEVDDA